MTTSSEPPQTSDPTLKQHLEKLRAAFIHNRPFCEGVISLDSSDFVLFYGKGPQTDARRIDLANASLEELQHLAATCDPASFGVQQKDVYDESYRKAGKLDKSDFAMNLSPDALGILDTTRNELLLETRSRMEPIRAELYKLNVYGPQSFFKAHVDTPRSELMFGSLVIVFPTPHDGGALVLRDDSDGAKNEDNNASTPDGGGDSASKAKEVSAAGRREWTIDSGKLLARCARPSIAYVAFFSDVEHEVLPVVSGYRVTLTYNLYYVPEVSAGAGLDIAQPSASPLVERPIRPAEEHFKSTLLSLLDDPTFLPQGGSLLFGLHHQYPLSRLKDWGDYGNYDKRRSLLNETTLRLKGSDAMLPEALRSLSLAGTIRMMFEGEYFEDERYKPHYIMCDYDPMLEGRCEIDHVGSLLQEHEGGVVVNPDAADPASGVHWVGPTPWGANAAKAAYIAHGNQAAIAYAYWRFALLVPIGPYGQRVVAGKEEGQ
ncbi:hypothetical protein C8Q73DRAFT_266812 [Cubamyces lactineus]|nr:hypothetical protein C8Q73DRAFT_266812 [Cubamyces lactineus]